MSLRFSQLLQYAAAQGSENGIMLADRYLSEMTGCLDGVCPTKAFGTDAALWAKELQDARQRLVYADLIGGDVDAMAKSIGESDLPDGVCLSYDGCMTSRRIDHDGDIVEAKGLEFPVAVPLLWQHVRIQPIGSLRQVTEQSEEKVYGKSFIADTPLGRDAATLVKCGALRQSIGFKPLTFDPRGKVKGLDGKDRVTGWHVKTARLMELSLVSIPANEDAVITAYSGKELKSDLANHWAKAYYDARPVVGSGFGPGERGATEGVSAPIETKGQPHACGCGGAAKEHGDDAIAEKAAKDAKPTQEEADALSDAEAKKLEKLAGYIMGLLALRKDAPEFAAKAFDAELIEKNFGIDEYSFPGSYEWVSRKLDRAARQFLSTAGLDLEECYPDVWATFGNEAFVVCRRYGSKPSKVYRIGYEVGADGVPKWTGDPQEIEIKPEVVAKLAAAPLWEKAADHSGGGGASAVSEHAAGEVTHTPIDLRNVDAGELTKQLMARAFVDDAAYAAVGELSEWFKASETSGAVSLVMR